MAVKPYWFEPTTSPGIALGEPPRLASWNSAGHPDQIRLKAYLHAAEAALAPHIARSPPPQALRLDVGLPDGTPLLESRDLDNFLFPLAAHLSKRDDVDLVSVVGTKRHGPRSFLAIDTARPTDPLPDAIAIRTTASTASTAYKEQVRDQLSAAAVLPDGPVHVELAFAIGPQRSWLNLWKPTIDALGPVLGSNDGRPWHPRDGRITYLALHRTVDAAVGNDVLITVHTRPAPPDIDTAALW